MNEINVKQIKIETLELVHPPVSNTNQIMPSSMQGVLHQEND